MQAQRINQSQHRSRYSIHLVNLLGTDVVASRRSLGGVGGGIAGSGGGSLDTRTVDRRADGSVVECGGALGLRELEPDDEDGLGGEVPGEVVENDAESEGLEIGQEAEDNPVGQPKNKLEIRIWFGRSKR